jgi:uncharacterized glyoxalase superfamily protein PhnB
VIGLVVQGRTASTTHEAHLAADEAAGACSSPSGTRAASRSTTLRALKIYMRSTIAATHARAVAAGAESTMEPTRPTARRPGLVNDPDGYNIELIQHHDRRGEPGNSPRPQGLQELPRVRGQDGR